MASKWHGQPCPLCGLGTLHDGIKTAVQDYKGYSFSSTSHGAFCDQCADGMVEYDAAEEAAELARSRKKSNSMRYSYLTHLTHHIGRAS